MADNENQQEEKLPVSRPPAKLAAFLSEWLGGGITSKSPWLELEAPFAVANRVANCPNRN